MLTSLPVLATRDRITGPTSFPEKPTESSSDVPKKLLTFGPLLPANPDDLNTPLIVLNYERPLNFRMVPHRLVLKQTGHCKK